MTGKFYMLFKAGYSIQEQLHWFISNYLPANSRNFEHKYVDNVNASLYVREGAIGVYTWDNGRYWSFNWLYKSTMGVENHTQVFYPANEIILGEYR